jgi:NTE family protein
MQTTFEDACIAFQGGGALGLAHIGAWEVLARRFQFVGVAGTSAGSIVAALAASNYSATKAQQLFMALKWPELVKPQNWINIFKKRDGWTDGEEFYQWIRARISSAIEGNPENVSFRTLFNETKIYLAIVAADLNDKAAKPVIFAKDTDPDALVALAVRASSSIPVFMVAVPRPELGQILVDGGVLLNLPLEPLLPLVKTRQCPLIGVRFDSNALYLKDPTMLDVLKRTKDIAITPGSLPSREILEDPLYLDVVIDTSGFNSLDFHLSDEQKEVLLTRGRMAAQLALETYDARINEAVMRGALAGPGGIEGRGPGKLVYVSRSWPQSNNAERERESAFANHFCGIAAARGFRLIGDSPDFGNVNLERIEFTLQECGGLLAVLPDRGDGETSAYIVKEICLAHSIGLPCLVIAESTVKLELNEKMQKLNVSEGEIRDISREAIKLSSEDLSSDTSTARIRAHFDSFAEAWQTPKVPRYVFLATDNGAQYLRLNSVVATTVERLTGWASVTDLNVDSRSMQHVNRPSRQEQILHEVTNATLVIANLSASEDGAWNITSFIEAGAARGAHRDLLLVCRGQDRAVSVMFEDMKIHFYSSIGVLAEYVEKALWHYHRKFWSEEGLDWPRG